MLQPLGYCVWGEWCGGDGGGVQGDGDTRHVCLNQWDWHVPVLQLNYKAENDGNELAWYQESLDNIPLLEHVYVCLSHFCLWHVLHQVNRKSRGPWTCGSSIRIQSIRGTSHYSINVISLMESVYPSTHVLRQGTFADLPSLTHCTRDSPISGPSHALTHTCPNLMHMAVTSVIHQQYISRISKTVLSRS